MSQEIYSFSIRKGNLEYAKLMAKLKKECDKTGQSFSYLVLQAIKDKYGRE